MNSNFPENAVNAGNGVPVTGTDANGCTTYTYTCTCGQQGACGSVYVNAINPTTGQAYPTPPATANTVVLTMTCGNDATWTGTYTANGGAATAVIPNIQSVTCIGTI